MKKVCYLLLLLPFFTACKSETQQKALDEVAAIYEATTGYSKGFSKNSGQASVNYFTITVSGSAIIDSMVPEDAASNIALIVYKNFTEEERKKFTSINVVITGKDSAETNRNYLLSELDRPFRQAAIFDKFSEAALGGQYDQLTGMVNPEYRQPGDTEQVSGYMKQLVSEKGKIMSYRRTGFGLRIYERMPQKYRFSGFFVFDNGERLGYHVETEKDPENQTVFSFVID